MVDQGGVHRIISHPFPATFLILHFLNVGSFSFGCDKVVDISQLVFAQDVHLNNLGP